MLLAKGAKVDSRAKNRFTPLHCRPPNGWSDVARVLLRAGAMVDVQANGQTPLHWAARKGNLAVAFALLNKAGADATKGDISNKSPIDHAEGKPELLRAALGRGKGGALSAYHN